MITRRKLLGWFSVIPFLSIPAIASPAPVDTLPQIKDVIANSVNSMLFELNDAITRKHIVHSINLYLKSMQYNRRIVDYKVICDETNNTPEVIDSNALMVDVYVKEKHTIPYMHINYAITPTGVHFEH